MGVSKIVGESQAQSDVVSGVRDVPGAASVSVSWGQRSDRVVSLKGGTDAIVRCRDVMVVFALGLSPLALSRVGSPWP